MRISSGERKFELTWRACNGPSLQAEHKFHPERRWRFDFAELSKSVAFEVEGGTFGVSRHTSGKGYAADCEKYNEAAMMGWLVIRLTPAMITVPEIERLIAWLNSLPSARLQWI